MRLKPDQALIDSMALRHRHDFGLLDERAQDSIRRSMEQLWEEVVGLGFYQAPAAVVPEEKAIRIQVVDLTDAQREGLRVKTDVHIPGAHNPNAIDVLELARRSGATDDRGGRAVRLFCFTSIELEGFVQRLRQADAEKR